MQRRDFIKGIAGAAFAGMGFPLIAGSSEMSRLPGMLLSACDDLRGNHFIAGIRSDGALAFQLPVPLRAHDSCVTPDKQRALFFARRPGHHIYVVDLNSGALIQTVTASSGRHFYGHGVISADGQWLFASEQRYDSGEGIIGVYRLEQSIKREAEFFSHAMDPHELQWLADGETLVIANGGIRTHPAQQRENLNPDTMQPALTYVRVRDGALLDSLQPPDHQMSLHHLDVSPQDQVVVGVQYQGALTESISLVGSHRRGSPMQWWWADELTQLRMQQYTASVAVNHNGQQAVVSCPRGNGIAVWDMVSGEMTRMLDVVDAAGVDRCVQGSGWLGTNGSGDVLAVNPLTNEVSQPILRRYPLRWDNHATLV